MQNYATHRATSQQHNSNIACNRNFKNANGEYDADFINCVKWREQAERFCNWTKKECWSELREEFRLEAMKEMMENVYMWTEVVAEKFQVLEKRDNTANQNSMTQQMPPNHANPMDIDESDLPF